MSKEPKETSTRSLKIILGVIIVVIVIAMISLLLIGITGFDLTKLNWNEIIWKIIIGGSIIGTIWLAQLVLSFLIKRKFMKNEKLPKDALNGLHYVIQIISALIILFVFVSYFGLLDSGITLSLTSIFATAIGFSSTIAIGNFVAGFYLIVSRPYNVGDYIKMNKIEGFVTEIGLNYTKVLDATTHITTLVPNKVAMNQDLLIYELVASKGPLVKKVERKPEGDSSASTQRPDTLEHDSPLEQFWDAIQENDKIVKYLIDTEHDLNIPSDKLLPALDGICEKWKDTFGYKPAMLIQGFGFRLNLRFVIAADDMNVIQDHLDKFLDDIWFATYQDEDKQDSEGD
ncbi:mechanosensitive ion channel [Candidatus Bathyarchaeota archaeon]|nr:mechanosensitive ion channel [Candidatus Bathyarchaeota archaeon]